MRAGQEPADRRLHVRKSGCDVDETEDVTRVWPDAVDFTAHTGPFALPEELRARGARCGVRGLPALPGS